MQKNNDVQSIYLDAVILIGYFERSDLGKHSREIISQVRRMAGNPEIVIKIPLIVLGEFFMRMLDRDEDFTKVFYGFRPEFEGPSFESFKLASNLMRQDKYLKPSDALLVAQAIVDETSEWLITTDQDLINNRVILNIIRERGSRLKISDSFKKH